MILYKRKTGFIEWNRTGKDRSPPRKTIFLVKVGGSVTRRERGDEWGNIEMERDGAKRKITRDQGKEGHKKRRGQGKLTTAKEVEDETD